MKIHIVHRGPPSAILAAYVEKASAYAYAQNVPGQSLATVIDEIDLLDTAQQGRDLLLKAILGNYVEVRGGPASGWTVTMYKSRTTYHIIADEQKRPIVSAELRAALAEALDESGGES